MSVKSIKSEYCLMNFRMPLRIFKVVAVIFVFNLSVGSPVFSIEASDFRTKYSVSLRTFKVAEFHIAGRFDDRSYAATGLIHTAGFASFIANSQLLGKIRGWVRNQKLQPFRYYGELKRDGKLSTETINYDRGEVVSIISKPERDEVVDINSKELKGTVDPMTFLFKAFRPVEMVKFCDMEHHLFDGRRSVSLAFGNIQRTEGNFVCTGEYELRTGFSDKQLKFDDRQVVVTYRRGVGDLFRLQKLVINTNYGEVVVSKIVE